MGPAFHFVLDSAYDLAGPTLGSCTPFGGCFHVDVFVYLYRAPTMCQVLRCSSEESRQSPNSHGADRLQVLIREKVTS